ncbi:hypothetical protein FB45DRAFT_1116087 [Roridomyces roridus]|uniref:NAD(P)-binding protein n=1 Tax=Roridomyces roridus TaxID=1738132 RepID=A0AAD7CBQ5_9AGAR|nr:hypothetical protein FB45DRAFT_1116087 [Roridomyces roridus]
MSSKIVHLVTGANRGIGYGLVNVLATRPNAVVFAANNEAAVAEIKTEVGQLDVVIANAGLGYFTGTLSTTPLSSFTEHWQVNTLGTVVLFQAAQDLLLASPTGAPIFAYISTDLGSIGAFVNFSGSAYGASKAASNYLIKVLNAEHPSLIAMAISPGWVATDMGTNAAAYHGLQQAPITLEDSVEGILQRVDGATKEKSSGRFWDYKAKPENDMAEERPW